MTFPGSLSRRGALRALGAAAALGVAGCIAPRTSAPAATAAGPQRLRLLAEGRLPHRMGFADTIVGGLSGIDFDPASGTWVALSDDRSELGPARFYTLRLDIEDGRPLRPHLLSAVTLRQAEGRPFPPRKAGGEVVDPEAIRLLPGGRSMLWASEGDEPVNQPPMLREATLDGRHVRDFELPPMFRFGVPGRGPRKNGTFEGLALAPDARTAWVAMEAPLHEDGPEPRVGTAGAPCRFTAFDVATGRAVRQIAYQPDAIPHAPRVPGGFADNGVSEILMIDARRMLVLERSYSMGVGVSLRLYEIDLGLATDTLALPRLVPGRFQPAPKALVADFAHLGLSQIDNGEGLCWGPPLANGRRCLVTVTDDNFNPAQLTQLAAFEFLE